MSFLSSRRKSRETIGVASALALVLSPLVVAASAAPAAADDPEVEVVVSTDFEDASWEDVWQQSGGPTLSVVDDGDNKVLRVADRAADYEGIETKAGLGLFEAGETYTFSMRAKLADDVPGPLGMRFVMKPAYTWIGNATVTGEWTTVSGTFTAPEDFDAAGAAAYIGTEALNPAGEGDDGDPYTYYVDDILITKPAAGPEIVSSISFDDDSYAPWTQSGEPELEFVDDGDGGRALSITRSADFEGIQSPTGIFEAGKTYTLSMRARLPEGATDPIDVRFVAKPEYTWVGNIQVTSDEWTEISGTYTIPEGGDPAQSQVFIGVGPYPDVADEMTVIVDDILILGPPRTVVVEPMTKEFDFEDGTLQGWEPREVQDPSTLSVEVTDAEAHESTYAAIVSGRTHQGQGIRYEVTDLFQAGVTYDVTAYVKFADGQEPGNISLTLETGSGTSEPSYGTIGNFEGMSNTAWVEVSGAVTMPAADYGYVYFETEWANGESGNTSTFLVDDIVFEARVPGEIQDLTPLQDTVPFPMGVAIDSRETLGAPSQLLRKHFNQITPENHMKPEAFYTATPWDFQVHPQAWEMVDFAQENGLGVYGHVLVWHSQTPDWFFQDDDGEWLTDSEADKQEMRDRMRTHIFSVAKAFHDEYGPYGSDTNPFVAWDVINEVVSDSTQYADGLRRSRWYQILGEEFIHLSFEYADEAFNDVYAAEGTERPIKLFINDYNTEQGPKQNQYFELVKRLRDNPDAPIDGVGHQFHLSLAQPPATLEAAIKRFQGLGLEQAVTELDVTVLASTDAQIVEQGHYYKEAFDIFRRYADDLACVTIWGLTDGRSWRSEGKPLLFDDSFQAKPSYYGAAGDLEGLPPKIQDAFVFRADVTPTSAPPSSEEWDKLRLLGVGSEAGFQLRWAPGRLVAYVDVTDSTVDASDAITFELEDATFTVKRDGSGDADAVVVPTEGGYAAVVELPVTGAAQGANLRLDVRVTDGASTAGWNSPGQLGAITLVEELSYLEVHEAPQVPTIDGAVDEVWSDADVVTTAKRVAGIADGAKAEVRTLWKDQHLYVLMDITDPVVDTSHSNPWEQDSVEIYVDGGNFKAAGFRYDDTQIRINADNEVSFGAGDEGFQRNRLESATTRTATGWRVEAAIDLLSYSGLGTFHGLDFQVNDGAPDSDRLATHNWADPTGNGYQSPQRWGVGQLVGPHEGQEPGPVEVAPKITLQPQDVQAKAGKTVTLRAAASGTPTPTVQWQKRAPGKAWASIKGATSTTLKVKNSKKASGTRYRAVFTNAAGKATTRAARVTVKPVKARVTQHPKSALKVRAGKKVTLRAKAKGAFPKATIQWQQRKPGKGWKNIKGATKSKLRIVANHKTDKVRYRAVFRNAAGTVRTKSARITVRSGKPAFSAHPHHTRVRVGKTATFRAEVAAKPKAKLQWFRKAPGSRTWVAVRGATKQTLRVRATPARSGTLYVAIATNAKGWTASKMARLTVKR